MMPNANQTVIDTNTTTAIIEQLNQKERNKLEDAGWRYATLIGVIQDEELQKQYQSDLITYQNYIKQADNGQPLWDTEESITLISQWTGFDRDTCAAWIEYDWS